MISVTVFQNATSQITYWHAIKLRKSIDVCLPPWDFTVHVDMIWYHNGRLFRPPHKKAKEMFLEYL